MGIPKIIVLFSGKRKCGKDFIAEKLHQMLGSERCGIIRISEPIKSYWAKEMNLDLQQLMSCGEYKEKYRKSLIEWSDKIRATDPGYFCKIACDKADLKEVWIVSDIRRETDIQWFKNTFGDKIRTVRILADENVRENRGWKFTEGVDDVVSECGLDNYDSWDLKINNNSDEDVNCAIEKITQLVEQNDK